MGGWWLDPPESLLKPDSSAEGRRRRQQGLAAALLAFGAWGLSPLYWKPLAAVPPHEIIAHRVVWSVLFLAGLLSWQRRWDELRVLRSGHILLASAAASLCIAANWLLFVWLVNAGRVTETSLGYFLNPLVGLLTGLAFFGERLRPWQWVAVGLAAVGVASWGWGLQSPPWASLSLCGSFALYSVLRKVSHLGSIPGLMVETALLLPAAVGYLAWRATAGEGAAAGGSLGLGLWLVGSGLVTTLPLLWFSTAARSLPLVTVSFLQYLSPSLALGLGVLAFGEPFTRAHALTFGAIWAGLAVFTLDLWRTRRRA